jgi:hypothetical protein
MGRFAYALLLVSLLATSAFADDARRMGAYRVEPTSEGLVVHAADPVRSAQALIAGGLALAAVGAWGVRGARRRGRAAALLLVGLGLAGVGATAGWFGGTTWLANRDGITERPRFGEPRFVARDGLAAIERERAPKSGTDAKGTTVARPFELELRATDGSRVARWAFESESEARAFGEALSRALGVELR